MRAPDRACCRAPRSPAPRRPSWRSPTSDWMQPIDRQHHHDQHRGVGDGDAVVAVLDAADDVGGRHLVLGADQEDHGADRGHRAHEAVDQRRHDRRPQQRQHDPAQRREAAGAAASARPRPGCGRSASASAMPARTPTGMLRNMKHSTRIEPGAGQLDRRHVEGQDVADADHRAGNREAQHARRTRRRACRRTRWRTSSQAISRPIAAVSGAAIAAICMRGPEASSTPCRTRPDRDRRQLDARRR